MWILRLGYESRPEPPLLLGLLGPSRPSWHGSKLLPIGFICERSWPYRCFYWSVKLLAPLRTYLKFFGGFLLLFRLIPYPLRKMRKFGTASKILSRAVLPRSFRESLWPFGKRKDWFLQRSERCIPARNFQRRSVEYFDEGRVCAQFPKL